MGTVNEAWRHTALEALGKASRRTGGARRSVVDVLARESCCVSAQEIAARLREAGETTGVASVYRALELLDGIGLVQRVETGDGGARYEAVMPGGEHHHHAVCETCGRLSAFEDPGLERAIERLARRLEHRVSSHDVLIRGQCARCADGARG